MTGFLRDLAGKRSAGLIGPARGPVNADDNPHDPHPVEPLCCSFHYPVSGDAELAEWERVADLPPAPVDAVGERLIAELKASLVRNEPLPGDRVAWHDGSHGTVAIIAAPWLEPGERIVYRHEEAAHAGAPSWCVEADSLTAAEVLADGRVQFTYRGSLR